MDVGIINNWVACEAAQFLELLQVELQITILLLVESFPARAVNRYIKKISFSEQFRHLSSFRIVENSNQNKSSDSAILKSSMRSSTFVSGVEPPPGVVICGILVSTKLVTLLARPGGIVPLC